MAEHLTRESQYRALWLGLHSLVRMRTERHGPRGRRRIVCYYIASLPVDAEDLPG